MAYVKSFDPGQLRLDLPSSNYYYELPLFSFGDTHGSIGVSLAFNYSEYSKANRLCYMRLIFTSSFSHLV
jgi:hypothetical protein